MIYAKLKASKKLRAIMLVPRAAMATTSKSRHCGGGEKWGARHPHKARQSAQRATRRHARIDYG
jgi:hypothetical protein